MFTDIIIIMLLFALLVAVLYHIYVTNRNFKRSEISKINLAEHMIGKAGKNERTLNELRENESVKTDDNGF